MVFQGESIFPWMTVWNNAAYGLRMRNAPAAVIKERVGHYLDATGLTRFRRLLSASALRRHEAARVDRARVCQRSGNPADGRAVLGARRAEQAPAAGGAVAHLGRAEKDRRVHHPQRRRSGLSRRPHHGDDGAARPREELCAGAARPAAQPHRIAEGAGIRRAGAPHLVGIARRGAARPRAGKQGRRINEYAKPSPAARRKAFPSPCATRERILGIASPIVLLVGLGSGGSASLHRYPVLSRAVERHRRDDRDAALRRARHQYAGQPAPACARHAHRRRPGARARHRHGAQSLGARRVRSAGGGDLSDPEKRHPAAGAAHLRPRRRARKSSWSRSACSFRW